MDRDVELWLSTKLEDAWSSEKLASQLSVSVIESLLQPHASSLSSTGTATGAAAAVAALGSNSDSSHKTKFQSLDTPIKLRLLFSFLSLTKQQNKDLQPSIIDFLRQLQRQCPEEDEWVLTIAALLETLLLNSSTSPQDSNQAAMVLDSTPSSPLSVFQNETFDTIVARVEAFLEAHPTTANQTPPHSHHHQPYHHYHLSDSMSSDAASSAVAIEFSRLSGANCIFLPQESRYLNAELLASSTLRVEPTPHFRIKQRSLEPAWNKPSSLSLSSSTGGVGLSSLSASTGSLSSPSLLAGDPTRRVLGQSTGRMPLASAPTSSSNASPASSSSALSSSSSSTSGGAGSGLARPSPAFGQPVRSPFAPPSRTPYEGPSGGVLNRPKAHSSLLSERDRMLFTQRKKRMRVLDMDEVLEITEQEEEQKLKKRRKSAVGATASSTIPSAAAAAAAAIVAASAAMVAASAAAAAVSSMPLSASGSTSYLTSSTESQVFGESEKQKKRREKEEQAQRRKEEREEVKRKKAEEQEIRRQMMQEKKAEKEARKLAKREMAERERARREEEKSKKQSKKKADMAMRKQELPAGTPTVSAATIISQQSGAPMQQPLSVHDGLSGLQSLGPTLPGLTPSSAPGSMHMQPYSHVSSLPTAPYAFHAPPPAGMPGASSATPATEAMLLSQILGRDQGDSLPQQQQQQQPQQQQRMPLVNPSLRPIVAPTVIVRPQSGIPQPGAPPAPAPSSQAPAVSPAQFTQALFADAPMASEADRREIEEFLTGQRVQPNPGVGPVRQIILSQREDQTYTEQILFEINYLHGTWKKLRRRIPLPHHPTN